MLGGDPKPVMLECCWPLDDGGGGGAAGTEDGLGRGGGRLEGMKGDEETGMEARGGEGGRAGRTVDWTE